MKNTTALTLALTALILFGFTMLFQSYPLYPTSTVLHHTSYSNGTYVDVVRYVPQSVSHDTILGLYLLWSSICIIFLYITYKIAETW
jgi:hypothetical protein